MAVRRQVCNTSALREKKQKGQSRMNCEHRYPYHLASVFFSALWYPQPWLHLGSGLDSNFDY